MFQLKLQNPLFVNEDVMKKYVDVYIHCEDNSIVEGHMVILAQQSPFCHRFFQSREGMKVADMFFTNIRHSVVKNAVQIIYGKLVNVSESDFKRVSSFLKMLQVEYQLVTTQQEESVDGESSQQTKQADLNLTFQSPFSPHFSKDDQAEYTVAAPKKNQIKENVPFDINDDNSTVTTESEARVKSIEHIMEQNESLKRQQYKCAICNVISLAFANAEKHFRDNHQDLGAEKELLIKVQEGRSSELSKFYKYMDISITSANKSLVQHELGLILENIENLISRLDNLHDGLPRFIHAKKSQLMKILAQDKKEVGNFIEKI